MLDSTRAALLAGALLVAGQSARAETVTLEQAVAKASEATPLLRAGDAAIAAARAGRVQAGVRPNPSVTLQGENFVGTGPYRPQCIIGTRIYGRQSCAARNGYFRSLSTPSSAHSHAKS